MKYVSRLFENILVSGFYTILMCAWGIFLIIGSVQLAFYSLKDGCTEKAKRARLEAKQVLSGG